MPLIVQPLGNMRRAEHWFLSTFALQNSYLLNL